MRINQVFAAVLTLGLLLCCGAAAQDAGLGVDYSVLQSLSEGPQFRHTLRVRVYNGTETDLSEVVLQVAEEGVVGWVSEIGSLSSQQVSEFLLELGSSEESLPDSLLFSLTFQAGGQAGEILIEGARQQEGGQ